MPGFDMTGPLGRGRLTGRGLGPCGTGTGYGAGYGRGAGLGRGLGRGYGRGFGRGFGWRAMQSAPAEPVNLSRAEEKRVLEAEKKELEKRLKELESGE